eukprot:UN21848
MVRAVPADEGHQQVYHSITVGTQLSISLNTLIFIFTLLFSLSNTPTSKSVNL